MDNNITITINGHDFGCVDKRYHDMKISEFVEAYEDKVESDRITEYLKSKYYCYVGVPFHCVQDEVLLNEKQIKNYLTAELGRLPTGKKLIDLFVPFELVSEMVIFSKDAE